MVKGAEEWRQTITAYNEEYEKVNKQIRHEYKAAKELLTFKKPNAEIAIAIGNLVQQTQRLVALRSEAGFNYRGLTNFYERALIARKKEIIYLHGKEKNLADSAAYEEAVIASHEEFELLNLAQAYFDETDGRFTATKLLIDNLHLRLTYGENP